MLNRLGQAGKSNTPPLDFQAAKGDQQGRMDLADELEQIVTFTGTVLVQVTPGTDLQGKREADLDQLIVLSLVDSLPGTLEGLEKKAACLCLHEGLAGEPWRGDGDDGTDLIEWLVSLAVDDLQSPQAVAQQDDVLVTPAAGQFHPAGNVVAAVVDDFKGRSQAAGAVIRSDRADVVVAPCIHTQHVQALLLQCRGEGLHQGGCVEVACHAMKADHQAVGRGQSGLGEGSPEAKSVGRGGLDELEVHAKVRLDEVGSAVSALPAYSPAGELLS